MPMNIDNVPHRKRASMLQAIGGYVNTGLTVIQGLVLIPLYLHYIGAHTYGLWLASGGILTWLGFVDMGISGMFVQRIARAYGQRDLSQVGAYFTNGMIISFCMSLMFVGLGLGVSLWLPELLHAAEQANLLQQCFQLAILATGLNIANECLRAFAQALLRPVFAILSLIACRVLGLAATIVFLFDDFGLWSIPLGSAITAGSVFMLNSANAARLFSSLGTKASISMEVLREYIHISPALFAGRIGNAMVKQIEPLLITIVFHPELATAYTVTKRAADIISQLLQVIIASSFPSFAHLAGEAGAAKITQVMRYIVTLIFMLGLIGFGSYIAMNRSFVSLWVGAEYFLDSKVVILIAAGALVMVLRNTISRMLVGLGDIAIPSLLMLLEAIVRVVLMAILLKAIGIAGVPAAMLVSCGVFLAVYTTRVEKRLPSAVGHGSLVKAALITTLAFIIALLIAHSLPSPGGWWLFAVYAFAVLAVFFTGTFFLSPSLRSIAVKSLIRH